MVKGVVIGVVCGALAVGAAQAQVAVSEAYLFSEWSSPPNNTSPSFTFTGTSGLLLFLDASGVATGQVSDAVGVDANIDFAFQYLSNTGIINEGEGFPQNSAAMGTRVDAEVGSLNDSGILDEDTIDAPLNVDFSAGAGVVFKQFDLTLSHILIAEDAGFDPFRLEWDADGDFSSGVVTLFNGFDAATRDAILARSDFRSDDTDNNMDQIFLFTFAEGLPPGFLRITEIGNFDPASTLLEIDFAGAAGATLVPEPSTFVTVGASIVVLGLLLRRRR